MSSFANMGGLSSNMTLSYRSMGAKQTMPNPETGVAFADRSLEITFGVHAFDEVDKGDWDQLFRQSGSYNLFYDYRTIQAAQLVWKRYRSLKVICGYSDNNLIFLQPIRVRGSGIAKVLELLSLPTADTNEPLVASGHWENATRRFLDFVSGSFHPDIIVAKSVSERLYSALVSHFERAHTGVKRIRKARVLYLPSTVEGYWSSLNSKSRNQLKRKIKKARVSGFDFRVIHSGGAATGYDLGEALDELTQLHRKRFDSMNRDSFFVKDNFQRFHRHLCERSNSAPVSFMFTEALLAGEVVGSIYGMRSDQVYIYLMIGFNPDLACYSVGNLLIYNTIEHLIVRQTKVFDFKCGKEPYKERWTKDFYQNYDVNVCFTKRGRLLDYVFDILKLAHGARRIPKNIDKLAHRAGRIPKKISRLIKSRTA